MMTVQQALELALRYHEAGRLAEAEALYSQILAVQPGNALAHIYLGNALSDLGQIDAAIAVYRRAADLDPECAEAHNNIGIALTAQGRLDEAIVAYRRAVEIAPEYRDAYKNMGIVLARHEQWEAAVTAFCRALELDPSAAETGNELGNALARLGRHDEALAAYQHALDHKPDFAEAHNNLGLILTTLGRPEEAIAAYRRALAVNANAPEPHHNLGHALRAQGDLPGALTAFRRALELQPDNADTSNSLGVVLREQGQLGEAAAIYRRALASQPDHAEVHNNLGVVLAEQGQAEEAMVHYQRALELQPSYPEAYNNLGKVFEDRGRLSEALAAYRRALELKPDLLETYNNVGNVLRNQGKLDEAVAAYRHALELRPDFADTLNNLGTALKDQGDLDQATAAYRSALALRPDFADTFNNLGNALKDQGDLDGAVATYRQVLELEPAHLGVRDNLIYTLNFHPDIDDRTIAAEQQRWNRLFSDPVKQAIRPHSNSRDPERRLRIGYVSPDFRSHVIGQNLLPLFAHHDHHDFEIVCYSAVLWPDKLTDQFRRGAEHWCNILGLTDEALAEIIRADGVDVLVDLTQHMSGNRLAMFARRPAPVQVSFAGYPASAGVEAIQYRISDRWLEAGEMPNEEGRMTKDSLTGERVYRLDSFWCYDPCGVQLTVSDLPARENGYVTFGSFNNFCKVNDGVLQLWARVLKTVERSRLILLSTTGSHRQRMLEVLGREGVARERVEFVGPRPRREYLALYQRVDMVLDPFPYNGHTTSLDALWMGVPVVSRAGPRAVSRAALSQLTNLGLEAFVACSAEDYVRIAKECAGDLSRLAELRRTLRSRMQTSVLMDAPHFARQIETAYRTMWREWCNREGGQ